MTQPESMKTKTYVCGVDKLNGNDAWAMFKACAGGDMVTVRQLLTKDSRLVNAQFWYQLPIHFAVRDGNAELVKLLLDQGADPGQSVFTYNSWPKLLLIAQERGYCDVESQLVQAMKKAFNYSPDFEALKNAIISRSPGSIDTVLRQQPMLLKASDASGNNAIHWSVITRQLNLIDCFIERGTPIDAERADGKSPLLLATAGGMDYWHRETRGRSHPSLRNSWVMVGCLLAKGAEYSISTAAAVGDQERVEQLLGMDSELATHRDSARISPLTYAAEEGHTHIVRLLLENGADPNLPEDGAPNGHALFSACKSNKLETAALLLEHGADPNFGVDSCGCCLTIGEFYHGAQAEPLQQLLRQHGAFTPPYRMDLAELKQALRDGHKATHHEEFLGNIMSKCDEELLDLYLAFDPTLPAKLESSGAMPIPNSPELVRKVLAHGLDVNQRDWTGRTLLHGCAEKFDMASAAILLDGGADIDAIDVEFRETPLTAAIRSDPWCDAEDQPKIEEDRREMIRFLLERGAATTLSDDEPWATPLAQAVRRGFSDVEQLLMRY